jgi:hypothetical protein
VTSALLPLALAAAVFLLGNALADGDYLTTALLGVVVFAGIVTISPGASAHPVPASAAEDNALATGAGR